MEENLTRAEETTVEWMSKLRYTRSFLAKLYLSDKAVKEAYCALCNKLSSFERVTARTTFSYVTFSARRRPLARIAFSGKTLTVYYALDPSAFVEGRYRVKDVSGVKKYARVPAAYKVRSKGGLKFALRLAEAVANAFSLQPRETLLREVNPKDFPAVPFQTLVSRGLIRPVGMRKGEKGVVRVTEKELFVEKEGAGTGEEDRPKDIFEDTVSSSVSLIGRHEGYTDVLNAFTGEGEIRFVRRSVVRSVDERWVRALEDCLPALDEVTRNPGHFIEETEELLPIERTKKVTTRSIKHLCQHTGLISRVEGDVVIPSKLLNVFRDESVMTYENKFVNTLLVRLYDFVTMRYEEAAEYGANRKKYVFSFEEKTEREEEKGKVSFSIEVSQPTEAKEKSAFFQSDLWARVEKLREVITDYRSSEFALQMGNASIRPPVVRTNPILKNKNLRQCLELWEFLEEYDDDDGGETTAEEELFVDAEQEKLVRQGMAQQYVLFRRFANLSELPATNKEKKENKRLAKAPAPVQAEPETEPIEEDERVFWVEVALQAEEIALTERREEQERIRAERARLLELEREEARLRKEEEEANREEIKSVVDDRPEAYPEYTYEGEESDAPETEESEIETTEENGERVTYVRSFAAKLGMADEALKGYYCAVENAFLSKQGVRERKAFDHVDFYRGRKTLARVTIVGKTLRVYYALDPASIEEKYNVLNCSDVKKYEGTPSLLKVRGPRGLKHALALCERVCEGMENVAAYENVTTDAYPTKTREEWLSAGEIRRRVTTGRTGFPTKGIRPALQKPTYDYTEEAAAYLKEWDEREKPKELVLETVTPTEIGKAIREVDEEEERAAIERGEQRTPVAEGGAGDPLFLREEALSDSPISVEEPKQEEPAEEPKPVAVQPDGDVLTPKPITAAEIDGGARPVRNVVRPTVIPEEKNETEKPEGLFARLFRKRK